MPRDRSHPFNDPADIAYRPPLQETAQFPSVGEVDHPNLKEALYQSLGSHQVVADIGCGPGPFEYANFQAQFIAFDAFEPDSRQGMKPQDKFMLGRLDSFPLEDASCDAVIMGYILEHVPDPATFVKEADRVLKPGGYCYIAVPHHKSFEDRLFRLATSVAGSTRGPHIQRFTFENLQQMVSACSSLELLTWHQLNASFLWMMHPRLRQFRSPLTSGLKLLRSAGLDLIRGSNMQLIFQKPNAQAD